MAVNNVIQSTFNDSFWAAYHVWCWCLSLRLICCCLVCQACSINSVILLGCFLFFLLLLNYPVTHLYTRHTNCFYIPAWYRDSLCLFYSYKHRRRRLRYVMSLLPVWMLWCCWSCPVPASGTSIYSLHTRLCILLVIHSAILFTTLFSLYLFHSSSFYFIYSESFFQYTLTLWL